MTNTSTFESLRKKKRPTIRVGRAYPFYSTLQGAENNGVFPHRYTGQRVRVVGKSLYPGHEDWVPGESERLFEVRSTDGVTFHAWKGELDGWFFETEQYVNPDGRWVR